MYTVVSGFELVLCFKLVEFVHSSARHRNSFPLPSLNRMDMSGCFFVLSSIAHGAPFGGTDVWRWFGMVGKTCKIFPLSPPSVV